nr:RAMP superfamily CRISPR-associated protein [uncultured Caldilinea sp.]
MSIRLEFEIVFKSDYHVGAGHGLGLQVDSALLRDPDKVPVIRGTVLAGLLRESMENLCQLAGKQQ